MVGRKTAAVLGPLCVAVLVALACVAWPRVKEHILLERLLSDQSERRVAAIAELAELGSPETISRLLQHYSTLSKRAEQSADEERALQDSLARLCQRWSLECHSHLLDGLRSADEEIRGVACETLQRHGETTPEVSQELENIVLNDPSQVRWLAARSLAKIEGARALPVLLRVLNDDELPQLTRQAAAMGIAIIGPEAKEAIPSLIRGLETIEHPMGVATALAGIGTAAVPFLLEELNHSSPMVRGYAASALENMAETGRIGGNAHAVTERLSALLETETDARAIGAALKVLAVLQAGEHDLTQ